MSGLKDIVEEVNELKSAMKQVELYREFTESTIKKGVSKLQDEFNNNPQWKEEFSLINRGDLNNQLLVLYDPNKSKQEYFSDIVDILRGRRLLTIEKHPDGSMVDNFMALLNNISTSCIDEISKEFALQIGVEIDEEMIAKIRDTLFENLRPVFKASIDIYEKHVNSIMDIIASKDSDIDRYNRINRLLLDSSSITVQI